MSADSKARMNRLFASDGRCLDVAIDHGIFAELSFLDGLRDLPVVVRRLVEAGPDALQMNAGQAMLLQGIARQDRPALVLRLDGGNAYAPQGSAGRFNLLQNSEEPLLEAIRLDAAAVVLNLIEIPGEPQIYQQCYENIARVRGLCAHYGMPLMIEPLALSPEKGAYVSSGDPKRITPLLRQARELGADLIKADPPEHPAAMPQLVEAAGCPLLVRGGGRADLRQVFGRSWEYLRAGAAGLVYGRNVYQQAEPRQVVRALMALIHEDATPEQAAILFEEHPGIEDRYEREDVL